MFANAMEYNEDGSDIYRAAVELREVTLKKAKEIDVTFDDTVGRMQRGRRHKDHLQKYRLSNRQTSAPAKTPAKSAGELYSTMVIITLY